MKSKKSDLKNPTKQQKILIIVAATLVAVVVALSIALPITLLKRNELLEVSFEQFDRLRDTSVTVSWNKISNTEKYTVEYCYGVIVGENIKKLTTQRTSVKIERRTGILSVRAKADDKEFSEWKTIDIPAIKLKAPTGLAVSDDLKVSWNPVNFDYNGLKTEVFRYYFVIGYGGVDTEPLDVEINETDYFALYVKAIISGTYSEELGDPWKDITFTFKVKASVAPKFFSSEFYTESDSEKYLQNAYIDSDYTEVSVTVTKEIYEGLKL